MQKHIIGKLLFAFKLMQVKDNKANVTLMFWYLWTKNFLRILSGPIRDMSQNREKNLQLVKAVFIKDEEKCKTVCSKCTTFVYVVIATLHLNILTVCDLTGQSPKALS